MNARRIGIMGAMSEEIGDVLSLLSGYEEKTMGMRTYYFGKINDIEVVVVFSRWGKVAAATTVSALIHQFGITELIFTGVAGAIEPELKIGDIVLGKRFIQHDLDARPLMKQYEIPLLGKIFLESDDIQLNIASRAIHKIIDDKTLLQLFAPGLLEKFNTTEPGLSIGDIASGDVFFSTDRQRNLLHSQLPSILCVEMEGAAVAQVCLEYQIPFTIIRTISDTADDKSHIDFPLFIKDISSKYSTQIIQNIFLELKVESNMSTQ